MPITTSSLKHRVLSTTARLAPPARLLTGASALALAALLIFAPLTVHRVALVTGLGIVVAGVVTLLRAPDRPTSTALGRWAGGLLVALGAFMVLWPNAGAPWLAFLVGAALLVHGGVSAVEALRSGADLRIAGLLAAVATLLVGAITFSWPVLTLSVFRFAVGGWLAFLGLQILLSVVLRRVPGTPAKASSGPIRRWTRTIAAALALLLAAAAAAGSAFILGGSPLPEPDAFYAAPERLPSQPGQLVRTEPLTTGVPEGAEAWKILFTTTHPDGSPAISSGTIVVPQKRGANPLPLLSVSHGTTGVAAKCAPSLSATPFADGAGTALEEIVTKHGWAAVTADYIGLGTAGTHPYLIGDAEARNVLDASRAAQQFGEASGTGIDVTTRTVVWGHSQGGQGALWTGQIARDYAPELEVEGIAAFAPAADLYGLANADKNSAPGKTVSAYIAATWNTIYPELELRRHLTPGSAGGVRKIQNLCFNGSDVLSAILYGTQVPNQIFPDRLLEGDFGEKLKEQEPKGPFPSPVLVAQGLADPLVKPNMQHDWVEGRCNAGEQIDYRTYPGLDHNSLVAADSPLTPQIVQWTLDRWAGDAPTPNCQDLPQ